MSRKHLYLSLVICSLVILTVIHVTAAVSSALNTKIISPASGTTLQKDTDGYFKFYWSDKNNRSANASYYWVLVGRSEGTWDITHSDKQNGTYDGWGTSKIPEDGSKIYVRLVYSNDSKSWKLGGDYYYYCPSAQVTKDYKIITPKPNTSLCNAYAPIKFEWESGAEDYWFGILYNNDWIVKSEDTLGGGRYYYTVPRGTLPTSGQITAVLYYKKGGT